jgi:hypothetical protein
MAAEVAGVVRIEKIIGKCVEYLTCLGYGRILELPEEFPRHPTSEVFLEKRGAVVRKTERRPIDPCL